jgi:hypothetical protein
VRHRLIDRSALAAATILVALTTACDAPERGRAAAAPLTAPSIAAESPSIRTESFAFEFEPSLDPVVVDRRVARDVVTFRRMGVSLEVGPGTRGRRAVRVGGPMPSGPVERATIQRLFDDLGVGMK